MSLQIIFSAELRPHPIAVWIEVYRSNRYGIHLGRYKIALPFGSNLLSAFDRTTLKLPQNVHILVQKRY